jgi:hypothetical protein
VRGICHVATRSDVVYGSEHSHRTRDISYYLTLVGAVSPIWSIVPLSWAYVVYNLYIGRIWLATFPKQAFFAAALIEVRTCACLLALNVTEAPVQVAFSIYYYNLARSISDPCSLPLSEFHELQSTFRRVLHAGTQSQDETAQAPARLSSAPQGGVVYGPSDPRAIDFKHALRNW